MSAKVPDHFCRGGEGVRGGDDFVLGTDAEGF